MAIIRAEIRDWKRPLGNVPMGVYGLEQELGFEEKKEVEGRL